MTLDELMAELRPQVEATMRSHGARETRIDVEAAERRRLRHALAVAIVRVGMWVDGRGHERVLTAESN